MMPIDKVTRGIVAYLDNELMTHIPNDSFKKVGFGVAVALAARDPMKIISSYVNTDMLKMLGILNAEGNCIEIELLRDELKKRMPTEGIKIPLPVIGNVTMSSYDLDTMISYINAA